jgi:hypothetical protein
MIFRNDPFDPRLNTHKIHALSARAGRTVYSVTVERDLRVPRRVRSNLRYESISAVAIQNQKPASSDNQSNHTDCQRRDKNQYYSREETFHGAVLSYRVPPARHKQKQPA